MRGEGHGAVEDVVLPPEPDLLQQDNVIVAPREDLSEGAEPRLLVEAEGPVEAPHVQVEHPQSQLLSGWIQEGCNAERTRFRSFNVALVPTPELT